MSEKDVADMRRLLAILLCVCLIWVPVRAAREEKLIALTFDDGPSGRFTRRLLEGLAQREVKATFLLCGYRMEQYPTLAQKIFEAGHEIGVHGYSHDSMKTMCQSQLSREIRQTVALLPDGCEPAFLRPPGGQCSGCVQTAAEDFCLAILQWSVDPQDWAVKDAGVIIERVTARARDGDVILLHDMSDSSVDAALAIIDILQARGFRFVTASELAQAKNCTLVPGKIYTRFCSQDQQEEK